MGMSLPQRRPPPPPPPPSPPSFNGGGTLSVEEAPRLVEHNGEHPNPDTECILGSWHYATDGIGV